MNKNKSWGIVGGGILGMTLAYRLASKGYNVSLYEASESLGGLANTWKMNDIEWDRFYHVILNSDGYLRELLKELDLDSEIQWVETKTGFYTGGKLYSMSNSMEFLRFPPLNIIDKFRLGITILYASRIKNSSRLEKIPVDKWLLKWSGRNTFEKIWLPLLKAKLGDHYKKTSAAFIWATIQRMYAARRSGLKKEMFGYIPGGYKKILSSFSNMLKDKNITIHTGWKANKIINQNNSVKVESIAGDVVIHDNIILTAPSPIVNKLCEGITDNSIQRHGTIDYLGVICPAVILSKSISPYYVTNITDDNVPFTGVIEMTSLADKKYFNGNSLIYLPKYLAPDDPLFDRNDEEIKKIFMDALFGMYPELNEGDLIFFGVSRARYVFALPTLEYTRNLPGIKTSIPGLFIINAAHINNGTLNVNETISLASFDVQK
ncbi:NAD(P)/FAD-dependent oxidoreductase [candidate division KSB1 bacterium]